MRSLKGLLVSCGLFAVLLWGVIGGFGMASAVPVQPVPERLQAAVAENGRVRVIVGLDVPDYRVEPEIRSRAAVAQQRQRIAAAQTEVLAQLDVYGVEVVALYETIPYLAVAVDAAGLEALANNPTVNYLHEDTLFFPTLGSSTGVIGAAAAWGEGYDGEGQTIVVIDTGVDRTHPFFEGRVVDEACFSDPSTAELELPTSSLCPNGSDFQAGVGASDPLTAACLADGSNLCFHGTHVAGIAAGRNATFQGVAPQADVIGIQVFFRIDDFETCFLQMFASACVSATYADILRSLEYVYTDLVPAHEIAAVNMSLGGDQYFDQATCDAELAGIKTVIDQLLAADVATVIASGNNGWTDSISGPGCVSSAVTVGATDDLDNVTSFSNMHGMVDLLAPGATIESAIPDGGYTSFDGTSMAAPHVAGAWAVLRQQYPDKGVNEILQILSDSGRPVADTRAGGSVTRPRIDFAALFGPSALISPGTVEVGLASQTSHTATMAIENLGQDDLHWSMLNVVTPTADFMLDAQNEFSLTHSLSQEILADNSVGCATGEQRWFRVFDLAEFGVTEPFKVSAVEFGVESSDSLILGQFMTVNLYRLEGEFGSGDMVLVQSAEGVIANGVQQLVRMPIAGSFPADGTLVVEIVHPQPILSGATVYGTNQAGETGPTYWQAPDCGVNEPTDTSELGGDVQHLVMNVWGGVDEVLAACNRPLLENWVQMDVLGGTIAPSGMMTVPLMIDASGLTAGTTYQEWLCVETNDVRNRLVRVPLVIDVSSCAGLPNCILPPQADFALSADEGIAPLAVTFTSLAEGEIDGLLWAFGDGGESTAANPEYLFETAGVYTVTMQVSNSVGVDTAARLVTVFAANEAAFTATMTQTAPSLTVTFHNLSAGDYDQCLWAFGDGDELASCEPIVTHSYGAAGEYEVRLAISGKGGIDIVEQMMVIGDDGEEPEEPEEPEVSDWLIYLPLVVR